MMCKGARTSVQTKYGETEAFSVEVGFHQGSALSPFLFLVIIDTMTSELRNNEELTFADDLVTIADTEEELLPKRVVYWCLRKRGVTEKLVRLVKMMYEGAKTTGQTNYGETETFPVEVGLHQGSALSPFLFLVSIDTLTSELRNNNEWLDLLFADD
ncbi:uncharacterized protein [Macrobrachium rosenbergii]|uniref:uncharacterized protein n=1 Tax=Macrobrachium rosenbergii TaxID=79674 RepID=UPI0034D6931C